MSNQLLNRAMTVPTKPHLVSVLLVLADAANKKTGTCWLSIKTIALRCKKRRRTIFKNLVELEALGYLRREQRTGQTSIFHLNLGSAADPGDAGVPKGIPTHASEDAPQEAAAMNIGAPGDDFRDTPPVHREASKPKENPKEPKTGKEREGSSLSASALDWTPSEEDLRFAKSARPEVDAGSVTAKFRDFYGLESRSSGEWSRTWRRWIRDEKVSSTPSGDEDGRKGASSRVERTLEEIQAFRAADARRAPPPEGFFDRYRSSCSKGGGSMLGGHKGRNAVYTEEKR